MPQIQYWLSWLQSWQNQAAALAAVVVLVLAFSGIIHARMVVLTLALIALAATIVNLVQGAPQG